MGEIVITMPNYDNANHIGNIIHQSGIWADTVIYSTGSEILQAVANRDIKLIICTRKLKDMGYEELASYLPVNVRMLLLTKDQTLLPFSTTITIMLMPFKGSELINTIKQLLPELDEGYKRRKPKRSAEDQKLIDDAKQLLMDKNGLNEADAFRYIQKNSMDAGRTMVESAQMILLMR